MRYQIELETTDAHHPGHTPPEIRLRHLLKIALRSLDLRCNSIVEVPDVTPTTPSSIHARQVEAAMGCGED